MIFIYQKNTFLFKSDPDCAVGGEIWRIGGEKWGSRCGQLDMCAGTDIFIRCIYGTFGREVTKYTVIYGVYIRFWPDLGMWLPRQQLSRTNI